MASGSHSSDTSRGVWPCRVSHAATVSPGRTGSGSPCVITRRAALSPAMIRVAASRSAHDSAFHRSSPPARCSGGRQAGHSRRRDRPARVDAGERQPRLELHGIGRPDARQVLPRLVVAAHQHVLAVVHVLARLPVEEGRGAAAELASRLEHEHPRTPLGQRTGSGQAGAARADDDDVGRSHLATRSPAENGDDDHRAHPGADRQSRLVDAAARAPAPRRRRSRARRCGSADRGRWRP